MPDFKQIRDQRVDLIVITHCHLDHIGSLPVAMREFPDAPVIMSSSSRLIIERMLHNSSNVMSRQKDEHDIPEYPLFTHDEIDRCSSRMIGLNYGMPKKFSRMRVSHEIEIVLHPAGHMANPAALALRPKHRRAFFTGDVRFGDSWPLPAAHFPVVQLCPTDS